MLLNEGMRAVVEVQGMIIEGHIVCVTETTTVVMFDGAEFPVTYDNESNREVEIDDQGDKYLPHNGSVLCAVNHEQEIH